MNIREAKKLYCSAVDSQATDGEGDHWWTRVRDEMEEVIEAKSDLAAARMIGWWGCWDRKLTATSVARKIRQTWAEMQSEHARIRG